MIDALWTISLLAEGEKNGQAPAAGLEAFLPLFVMLALVWYFVLHRPQRRDKARRDQLLNELKKNDRVVTIGGIIGTVANVSDDKEVTLKVDDNTRIKMLRSSIQTVLTDEGEGDATRK